MTQNIKEIDISDLVLWTENPRDPFDANSSDQQFADKAINGDQRSKWSLRKLFDSMGPRYDQSEIPTVVYKSKKPIVYDGNRRVLIGKIIHKCVTTTNCPDFTQLDFPRLLPCNVCDRETAIEHIDRKHGQSGSWDPLERDTFRHREMKKDASPFLILENATYKISSNHALNKRFVSEEIFDANNLREMGFSVSDGSLKSHHNQNESKQILDAVEELVVNEEITTRKNRGKIIDLLNNDKEIKNILSKNKNNTFKKFQQYSKPRIRKTPIAKAQGHQLFGETLTLATGTVNNIYSDLLKIYHVRDAKGYSKDLPRLIRMGLRLICDVAAAKNETLSQLTNAHYDDAKKELTKDEKTTLSTNSVTKGKIVELLHVGAHAYTSSNNLSQTVAISLIIGKILEITHGKHIK